MKEDSKGAKKEQWRSFLVRAFPPLSPVNLTRYFSKRPVMQARHRLRGGRGGGSTLLFMVSLLSVCGIKGVGFEPVLFLGGTLIY